ncbi:glycine zipper family protein [Acidisphaera sp. S103]|uniref:glycine zipper family protein n=1 Tax=Acidisphaera sp. S103 TaxID=1747223 RepID=UPI00131B8568|nr:glycine zipper family protein [Acidisphaera sp. S103]
MKRIMLMLTAAALSLAACSDMTPTQQRAVSGTGIGAAGGAVIGAIAGNAGLGAGIGAVAGLAGGLIYDQAQKNRAASYRSGYSAGANGYAPNPPH